MYCNGALNIVKAARIFPNEPIDTRSKSLGPAACTKNRFVVDGKSKVHLTHIACARQACQGMAMTGKVRKSGGSGGAVAARSIHGALHNPKPGPEPGGK
jgi:hypothetical protein